MYNNITNGVTSSNGVTDLAFATGLLAVLSALFWIIVILIVIGLVINYKLFKKLGLKGWQGLIPIYSTFVRTKFLTGNSTLAWLVILSVLFIWIPILNVFIITFMLVIDLYSTILLTKGFNKNFWVTILLNSPLGIFVLGYLAFSNSTFDESLIEGDRLFLNKN